MRELERLLAIPDANIATHAAVAVSKEKFSSKILLVEKLASRVLTIGHAARYGR
jgi:hypothetical protein